MRRTAKLSWKERAEVVKRVHERSPPDYLEYLLSSGTVDTRYVAGRIGVDYDKVRVYRRWSHLPEERQRRLYVDTESGGLARIGRLLPESLKSILLGEMFIEVDTGICGGGFAKIPAAIEPGHRGGEAVLMQTMGSGIGVDFENGVIYTPEGDTNRLFYASRGFDTSGPVLKIWNY